MKPLHKIASAALVLLLLAAAYGIFRTTPPATPIVLEPGIAAQTAAQGPQNQPVVDQTPLLTAQRLAQMPTSSEELPLAQEALRIADHEMDLAFAMAVREATEHPPVLTPKAKEIQAQLQKAQKALAAEQAQVDQLTAAVAKAKGPQKDALNSQLEQAKAQLELDQDEVDDAKQDLMEAGGDPQARIQAMVQEHEASSQKSDTTKVNVSVPAEGRGLIHRVEQWWALHQKQMELWQAKKAAESAAAIFAARHEVTAEKVRNEKVLQPTVAAIPPTAPAAQGKSDNANQDQSQAFVKATRERAGRQKALATFSKREDNEKQLAGVYAKWIEVVAAHQRTVINYALRGVVIILAIALIGLFFDGWIGSLLKRAALDRRQLDTLHAVVRVSLQVIAVLLVLLVIFGPPSQLGTFLGLAGAGLTVALKDFIVGFIGWFVLMGKNGIRLGDWVEINGVTGEVVELGMFHTVLLETGNWTDSGHPTGRRVTFTNSFAIEGHYFNFSTSGQWLWDELQVVLPSGQDPYPIVDAIQKKVQETTADSAREAELEWQRSARSRGMSALSAAPAIDVKPVIGGIEIAVRYITRAHERYQRRAKLNQLMVDLLGPKARTVPAPAQAAAEAPAKA
jgi:small-conductance mechanosensitive channel